MRTALNGLGRGGLIAVMAALTAALVMVLREIFMSDAGAQGNPEPDKHAWCHATGSATNPFTLVVVQEGGPLDVAHEGHADDVDLGETHGTKPGGVWAMQPGGTFDAST